MDALEEQYLQIERDAHALRLARLTLEEEAKRQTELALSDKVMALATSVRKAYSMVGNKSAILRAMHTKDRGTLDRYLALTEAPTLPEAEPEALPEDLTERFVTGSEMTRMTYNGTEFDPPRIKVKVDGEEAEFDVDQWDNGATMLYSRTPTFTGEHLENVNRIALTLDGKDVNKLESTLGREVAYFLKGWVS